jgi:hypothetical protein
MGGGCMSKKEPQLDEIDLLNKSIKHYKRMIGYAMEKPPGDKPQALDMKKEIGEAWYAEDCPLCQAAQDIALLKDWPCEVCVLRREYESCYNGLWYMMDMATSWEGWIKYAKKFMGLMIRIRDRLEHKRKEATC